MSVTTHREGTIAYVTLDNPPVNAIGLGVREGLERALDWVEGQAGLSRVILTGTGRTFAAGGDAREFDIAPVAPHLPDLTHRIENCGTPWIAVLNGAALGGGCELALACRFRIAAPGVQIGLPEVTLGVVPGAGGTQRLPRLIGMAAALDLISTGRSVSSEKAERLGLIDGTAQNPLAVARGLDIGTLDLAPVTGELPVRPATADQLADARRAAARKSAQQTAPQVAIDLVEASAGLDLKQGMARERAAFLELRGSDQSRALRHMFFSQRGAKAPGWLGASAPVPEHVAVVGGGTMGAGIAYALSNAGLRVTLLETDAEGVKRAAENIDRILRSGLSRGLIDNEGAKDRLNRITMTEEYGQAATATLAIEAAFESMEIKQQVFSRLETHLPATAILATNTSYLDVDAIAATVADPSRVLGLHFFAPAHIMKLLEIVRGGASSDTALATGYALAKRLGKVPVLAGVCDGFIGNRILARYREAAETVLLDGSTPWEIDEAMTAFGYAMGPFEAQDLSGLDIAHANRRRQDGTRDPARRYIPISDRMVELGKLGRKTGAGWYRYPGGGGKVEDPIVADLALEEAHFAGITRCDYSPPEIQERLLLAMINEAADILHEGIAASAADIDLVTVFGYGFPRWRGGLMHYADTLGAAHILDRLQELASEDPVVWRPSPLLQDCVAKGLRLADHVST